MKTNNISNLLDDIDLDELLAIDIDEEVDFMVDKKRIMDIAIEGVSPTKKFKLPKVKPWLVAASLLLVGTTTVVASESVFNYFSGNLTGIMQNSTNITNSITKNGITFSVQGAISDNHNTLVIITANKKDGSMFDPNNMEFESIDIVLDKDFSTGYAYDRKISISEDNKELTILMDIQLVHSRESGSIADAIKGIKFSNFGTSHYTTNNFNLAELMEQNAPIVEEIAGISLQDLSYNANDNTIEFVTQIPNDSIPSYQLIDSRTGYSYGTTTNAVDSGDKNYWYRAILFRDVDEADLPYLTLECSAYYFISEIVGLWEIDIDLNSASNVINVQGDTFDNRSGLTIDYVEVSPFGINIRANFDSFGANYFPDSNFEIPTLDWDMQLQFADKSIMDIEFVQSGAFYDYENRGSDTTIGDTGIQGYFGDNPNVSEISFDDDFTYSIIDLNEVEAILVDNEVIWAK
ncbi:MAG: hypothetical protein ATN35_10650 [Epulopiscium sp. Nele67-Bin004]|nr:MAG: hypothetical protein ATN35_10650 [Epulopiscium sp. Nele67-Bin004]